MKKLIICTFVAVFIFAMTSGIVRAGTFVRADGTAIVAGDMADICAENSGNAGNEVLLEAGTSPLECGIKVAKNVGQNFLIQCTLANATFGTIPGLTTDGAGDLDLDASSGSPIVTKTSGDPGDSTITWLVNRTIVVNKVIVLDTEVDATDQGGDDSTVANKAIEIEGLANGDTVTCTWTILDAGTNVIDTATGTVATGYNCLSGLAKLADDSAAGPQTDTITVASGRVAFDDDGTDFISEAIIEITDTNTPGTGGLVAFDPAGVGFDTTLTVTGDFTGVTRIWYDDDDNDTFDTGVDVELTGTGETRSAIITHAKEPLVDGGNVDLPVKILVDESVLQTRTYQAAASSEASANTENDRTDMLAATNFIVWNTDGYQGRLPYLDTRATVPSFCVVNNTTSGTADVFWDVLANDAGTDVSGLTNISLGTIGAETTALLSFVGDQVTLGSNTPVTVAVGTDARSSGLLTITVNPNGVLVNCFQSDAATGGKRVLGVMTEHNTGFKN